MNNIDKKLFQEEQEHSLPLIAHFLNAKELAAIEVEKQSKYVAIDFYQSQTVKTYPYYKPISKIITSASFRK